MSPLGWILGATVLISLTAWVGVLALFLREDLLDRLLLVLVALAAGGLIGGAFLHLLPSALAAVGDGGETLPEFLALIVGFCSFYVLAQFVHWHHHHAASHDREPVTYLDLLSDTLHNFIDGLVIAGSFVVGVPVGVVTTLAIALHEISRRSATSASSSTAGSTVAGRWCSTT